MNRLYFCLAGCFMAFGDVVFLVAFSLTSWMEQEVTVGGFQDGMVVHYGLWRTVTHHNFFGRSETTGIKLPQAACGLMVIALLGLIASAALYIILWCKLHKFFVLGTIVFHLLAGVMCSISLGLVANRKRHLSTLNEDRYYLTLAFWLATGSTIVIFFTAFLIGVAIFIREPFPNVAAEQPGGPAAAPQPGPGTSNNPRGVRRRTNLDRNLFNSSRNSMISDSQTDFSSSSFGSTSVLPSGENGVESSSNSLLTGGGSSLRGGTVGMSVSDYDIRARTAAVNLAAEFSDDSLHAHSHGIAREDEIELQAVDLNLGNTSHSNSLPSVSTGITMDTMLPSMTTSNADIDDVFTESAQSSHDHQVELENTLDADDSSGDECTVDRVVKEDILSRDFTRSDLNLIQYSSDTAGRIMNGNIDSS